MSYVEKGSYALCNIKVKGFTHSSIHVLKRCHEYVFKSCACSPPWELILASFPYMVTRCALLMLGLLNPSGKRSFFFLAVSISLLLIM